MFWKYSEASNSYLKSTAVAELCDPPFSRWRDLTEYLIDAKTVGHDHSEFEGGSQECEIIEATYETPRQLLPGVPSAGRLIRTFCIDPVRHLILRERLEPPPAASSTGATHFSMLITYSHVELNPALERSLFQFQPPAGSTQMASGADSATGGRTSPPVLLSEHEPKYSPEALKARLQGTIRLSLIVGTDGVPQDVKVVRGLGLGLDEKAVDAVQRWRFKPATRGGEPITVPAQVEVNSRFLNVDTAEDLANPAVDFKEPPLWISCGRLRSCRLDW